MASLNLTNLWLGDPQWQHATWAVKGLQAQLWLLAAQRTPAGTLPDDDKWLRKALNIPTPSAASRAKKAVLEAAAALPSSKRKTKKTTPSVSEKIQSDPLDWTEAHGRVLDALFEGKISEDLQDAQQEAWLDHLWINHWKHQLFEGWERITENLIETRPELKRGLGGWYHPLADLLSKGGMGQQVQSPAKASPKAKSAKGVVIIEKPFDHQNQIKPEAKKVLVPWWGSLDEARLLQLWTVPLSKDDRSQMWEVGISQLAGGGRTEVQARGFLSKMVKLHGEIAVHQAIQKLAMRAMPPADSFSFLQGILNQQGENGGSPAEQKARAQRSKVAL